MRSTHGGAGRKGTAAVAENADPARVEAAIRRVVELERRDGLAAARAVGGDQARPELRAFLPVHREPGVLRRAGPDVPGARGEEGLRGRRDRLRAHDAQAMEDRALRGIREGPDHQVLQEDRDLRCRESGRRRAGRSRSHPRHHLPRAGLAQARAEHGQGPEGVRRLRAPQRVGQGAAEGSREARRRPGAAQGPASPVRSGSPGARSPGCGCRRFWTRPITSSTSFGSRRTSGPTTPWRSRTGWGSCARTIVSGCTS